MRGRFNRRAIHCRVCVSFLLRHELDENHHVGRDTCDDCLQEHKIHLKEPVGEHQRLVQDLQREVFGQRVDSGVVNVLLDVVQQKADVANLLQAVFTRFQHENQYQNRWAELKQKFCP